MKFTDITEADLKKEYERISGDFIEYFKRMSDAFSDGEQNLMILPKEEYPFSLAKKLHALWLYAKGEKDSPEVEKAESICDFLSQLYWMLPGRFTYSVEWQVWDETVIGCIVRTALARAKLNRGEDLSGPEVALLSGLSIESINKYTLSGRLPAEREPMGGKRWIYKADEIRKFISGRAE